MFVRKQDNTISWNRFANSKVSEFLSQFLFVYENVNTIMNRPGALAQEDTLLG